MNTEHVDVGTDFSDAQVAEIFLHHRVLIVPVLDDGRVVGVITRTDFFRALAERFLERTVASVGERGPRSVGSCRAGRSACSDLLSHCAVSCSPPAARPTPPPSRPFPPARLWRASTSAGLPLSQAAGRLEAAFGPTLRSTDRGARRRAPPAPDRSREADRLRSACARRAPRLCASPTTRVVSTLSWTACNAAAQREPRDARLRYTVTKLKVAALRVPPTRSTAPRCARRSRPRSATPTRRA